MLAVNYTTLRDNMKDYFDQVADSFEPLIVTRKDENMVIMSQTQYDRIMETVYLMENEKNREHLRRSMEEYRTHELKQHELIEAEDD